MNFSAADKNNQKFSKKVQVWVSLLQGEKYFFLLFLTFPQRIPTLGSFWQPITGNVELHENLEVAALREFQEETGLGTFKVEKLEFLDYSFAFESHKGKFHEYVYHLHLQAGMFPKVQFDSREHIDFQWVEAKQVTSWLSFKTYVDGFKHLYKRLDPSIIKK